MEVTFTKHAKMKIKQRGIDIDYIKKVIVQTNKIEPDKFDKTLTHFVGKINDRYLRVIARLEMGKALVISAFYDRRLKRRKKNDKD